VPNDIRQVLEKHEKARRSGRCLFVDKTGYRCSGKSIGSHTVQKSDSIRFVAEAGHVLSLGANRTFGKTPPVLGFKRVGQSKASVFPGFCAKHDADIFGEIERGLPISTKRQAALLGYRVTCLEYFKKEMNIALFSNSDVRKVAKSNGTLGEVNAFLTGTKLGFSDLKRSKEQYESALHNNLFDTFHAVVVGLSSALPFCFASPFAPEFTFDGRLILPQLEAKWESVSVFAGRLGGSDVIVVCGFESDHHDIVSFINSATKIPNRLYGGVALNLALEYAENTFFRESWVNNLDDLTRSEMIAQFLSGTPGDPSSRKQSLLSLPDRIDIAQVTTTFLE
jgi:hypothetical protein